MYGRGSDGKGLIIDRPCLTEERAFTSNMSTR